jgi:hypothetical protein
VSDDVEHDAFPAGVAGEGPASRRVEKLGGWPTLCYVCS